jgi:diguanylate cyclase (GGDEF)-like protein/PAS domain S-box-containing protein
MDESIEVEAATLDQTLLWASRTILDSVADAIVTIDDEGQIRAANRAATELFEYSPEEIGQLHIAELVGRRDRRQLDLYLNVFLASASRTPGSESWFEAEGIRKDGSSFPMELRASPLVLSGERIAVAVLRNIRERKAYTVALEHHALHDSLTGLGNRVLFEDRLTHAIQTSQRTGQPFVVLLCDLDGFKTVNDRFGHEIGDMVLSTCSHRLRQALREPDTIARIGGDEFAIIPQGVEEPGDAVRTAKAILETLQIPIQVGESAVDESLIAVQASIGIACYPADGDRQSIVRKADVAMYAAKRSGEQCAIYTSRLEALRQNGNHTNGNHHNASHSNDGATLQLPAKVQVGEERRRSPRRLRKA